MHGICPIHKKKAVSDAENYRGIHLTAQISKHAKFYKAGFILSAGYEFLNVVHPLRPQGLHHIIGGPRESLPDEDARIPRPPGPEGEPPMFPHVLKLWDDQASFIC